MNRGSSSPPESRRPYHHELKLYCVKVDATVMQFVVDAVEETLARVEGRRRKRA
jgi:hypothetical protein